MKEELVAFIQDRIDWHQLEQKRLKAAFCNDQAAHMQICINVYNIFLSTYQAMQYDLDKAMSKFAAITGVWEENKHRASEHHDETKVFIEQLKLDKALEITQQVKKLEQLHHD